MFFAQEDFPIFTSQPSLVYLDSAATTLKPQSVIDVVSDFYAHQGGTVHRGIYSLAEDATLRYEQARRTVAQFIGAQPHEIVFTSGATASINFIAYAWALKHLKKGDEVILSEIEHHANILPWIRLEKELDIVVRYIPFREGNLDYTTFEQLLSSHTKLISITHTSNVLGLEVDIERIKRSATTVGARILVDATQATGHQTLDVKALQVDFIAFSGHKMLGPTGIGVLYIAEHLHDQVIPYQVGGGMVHSVDFHDYVPSGSPHKFEAGTPPIAEALGLEAAIVYLQKHSLSSLKAYEASLSRRLIEGIKAIPSLSLLPGSSLSSHIVSFMSDRLHPHDIAAYLNQKSISVRAGNHCAQPLHKLLGIEASVRVSFSGYSTLQDVAMLLEGLHALPQF